MNGLAKRMVPLALLGFVLSGCAHLHYRYLDALIASPNQYLREVIAGPMPPPPIGTSRTIAGPDYAPGAPLPASPDPATDWGSYNRTLEGDRFSPLDRITTANVDELRPLCDFRLADATDLQGTPLEIAGTLYVTTQQHTYAIDARTCRLRWEHIYHLARRVPLDPNQVNRGLAYWHGLLIRGSNDGRLYALNAATGGTVWNVPIGDPAIGETFPAAPIVWHGMVFIGNAGGDNFGVAGRMMGFDARTGLMLWSTPLIPSNGRAAATWQATSFEHPRGGAATWTSYAIDPRTGILYAPTGNAAPDFLKSLRPGANDYAYGVIGLDARTGSVRFWHQFLSGDDVHDWDMAAAPELITTPRGRKLLVAAGKDGFLYALDRETGKLAVKTAITTRFNTRAPMTPRGTRFCPGIEGGVEWSSPAYSPQTDALYVNAVDWCTTVRVIAANALKGRKGLPWTGSTSRIHPYGLRANRYSGWITAVSARTGAVLWRLHDSRPMLAGTTPTEGGVVFTGDLNGLFMALDQRTGALLYRYDTGQPIGGGVITYADRGRQYVAVAAGMDAPIGWRLSTGPGRIVVFGLPGG